MRCLPLFAAVLFLPFSQLFADEPSKPSGGEAVVVDAAGKEVKLKKWHISAGTRKLGWLEKDGVAPEALAFRETNSTLFKDGVVTLIPLDRLESLTYDVEKQTVQAKVAGLNQPLEGSIRYKEINQITIEAEVDKGDAGIVELKYKGGQLKGGIRSVKFSGAKAGAAPVGEKMFITIADAKQKHPPQAVVQLQALYKVGKEQEKLATTLMFKKTYKVELAQIQSMKVHDNAETKELECEVTLKDGTTQTLTPLTATTLDGKPATLEGLLGAVPAGYRLFPLHTVGELSREEPKKEKDE
ncbi:MAG TPA: hypothetical protein VKS79_25430 [Gemmataceae bacterium]|nr:hypothetical protein [Gemmataceae bacterium]